MKKSTLFLISLLLVFGAVLAGLTVAAATTPKVVCRAEGNEDTVLMATDGTVTLPTPTATTDRVFAGWLGTVDGARVFLPASAVLSVEEDVELEAVYIGFKTLSSPEVRAKDGDIGLRFITEINRADYERVQGIVGKGSISHGTYVVAGDYLSKKSKEDVVEFTLESLAMRGFTKYIDIPSPVFTKETSKTLTYTGAVINILKGNYTREYAGIGYIKLNYSNGEAGTIYCQYRKADHRHSIYNEVFAAYNDRNPNYEHLIIDEENGLTHSPYTKEQLDAMKKFLDRCIALSFNDSYRVWTVNRGGAYYLNPIFSAEYNQVSEIITVTPVGSASVDDIWGISIGGSFFDLSKATIKDGKFTYFWSSFSSRQ